MDRARRPRPLVSSPSSAASWLFKGAVSGLVAGAVMLAFLMIASALSADALWAPPRTIAALFAGESAVGETFEAGPVFTGLLIHAALSALFGVICAAIIGVFTNRLPLIVGAIDGLMYGGILWAVNTFLIAPVLPGGELIENNLFITTIPSWAWATSNVLYGLLLGLIYGWSRDGETTIVPSGA